MTYVCYCARSLDIYKAVSNYKKKKKIGKEKGWTKKDRNAESVKIVERNREGNGKYRTARQRKKQNIIEQKDL